MKCISQETQKTLESVEAYIHKYVDVPEDLETFLAGYAMSTWVCGQFSHLRYLHIKGKKATGKTRLARVVGSVCFKPIWAASEVTDSGLLYCLNDGGTLIADDVKSNSSVDELLPVVFSIGADRETSFVWTMNEAAQPIAHAVFSPKIIVSEKLFSDASIQSRCFSISMKDKYWKRGIHVAPPDGIQFKKIVQEMAENLEQWSAQLLRLNERAYFNGGHEGFLSMVTGVKVGGRHVSARVQPPREEKK